jgi:hypothetical protein
MPSLSICAPQILVHAPTVWDHMTAEMKADVLGPGLLDHTAAVNAALAMDTPEMVFPGDYTFNTGGLRLPPLRQAKHLIFEDSTFLLNADAGQSFLTFPSMPEYGDYDDLWITGGTLDQGDFDAGFGLFRLYFMRDALIEGMTVRHRNQQHVIVTADPDTDTFTCTANPFINGDQVVEFTDGTRPGGVAEAQYFVVNATGTTFQVSATLGGSAIDVTSEGTGEQWFVYRGSMGFRFGGMNVELVDPVVENGTELHQDAVHVIHGSAISVRGGVAEAGDDAFVAGGETQLTGELTIDDVEFVNCVGTSHYGTIARAYVLHEGREVHNVSFEVSGSGGLLRNGPVSVDDNFETDLSTDPAKLSGISLDINCTGGSAARTQNVNSTCLKIISAVVAVQGTFLRDTYPLRPYDFYGAEVTGTLNIGPLVGAPAAISDNSDITGLMINYL